MSLLGIMGGGGGGGGQPPPAAGDIEPGGGGILLGLVSAYMLYPISLPAPIHAFYIYIESRSLLLIETKKVYRGAFENNVNYILIREFMITARS